jgi:hypothetical protein
MQEIYVQISASDDYTCGVTARGAVKCWGNVPTGKLPTTLKYAQVTAGPTFVCALSTNATVHCFGMHPLQHGVSMSQ